jgi:hypothetical protein
VGVRDYTTMKCSEPWGVHEKAREMEQHTSLVLAAAAIRVEAPASEIMENRPGIDGDDEG